jgi:hypothetical protein
MGPVEQIEKAKKALRAAVRGDDYWRHPDLPEYDNEPEVNEAAPMPLAYQAAHQFLSTMFGPEGYPPDAVGQLVEVFLPCLQIMVDHNWGELWRGAGLQSIMDSMKSKFDRYWERTWVQGNRHADSGFDLINVTGFSLRQDPSVIWGNRGKPAWSNHEEDDHG